MNRDSLRFWRLRLQGRRQSRRVLHRRSPESLQLESHFGNYRQIGRSKGQRKENHGRWRFLPHFQTGKRIQGTEKAVIFIDWDKLVKWHVVLLQDTGGIHDFVEILKLYDKNEDNTILGNELFRLLTNLGEKLTKEEAKSLMKELCEPEDDEGFMPFMRKSFIHVVKEF